MIKKILKIKNFGSFKNYIADNNLVEFKKYNLLFGLNGTGKTTLSNLFRCLNEGKISDDLDNNSFKEDFDLLLDNNQHITKLQENMYCNYIKIFNRDFVNNNLTLDNNNAQTNALTYTIGETAKEIKDKIAEQEKKLKKYYTEVQGKNKLIIQQNVDETDVELENIYKDTAEFIRRDLNIKNSQEYTSRHFKQDYSKFCENKVSITEDEKNEYAQQYIQPVKQLIPEINFQILTGDLLSQIVNILSTEIKRANVKEELVQWLEKGLELKSEDKCPFCNKALVDWEERYKDIQNIVKKDDKFIKFENDIKEFKSILNQLFIIIKNMSFSLRTDDFCNIVSQEILDNYNKTFEKYKNFIDNLINLLNQKKSSPDKIFLLENHNILENYIKVRDTINALIIEHNNNVANIKTVKDNAKSIVVNYYIQQCKSNVVELLNKLRIYKSDTNKVNTEITIIKAEIKNLNVELSNQKAPMSEIEKYIYAVFGHKKFNLTFDEKNNSYYICRESGEIAKNLSEGEKTVVAFAYFLATLKTRNFDMKNAIIVIDDPISSLDQQYLFNLTNLLTKKFINPKTFEQLFVLTHNFYFYKKLRAVFMSSNRDSLEMFQINKKDSSYIENADRYLKNYSSEYTHIIKYLKQVLKMPDEDVKQIPIGNSIRKILEIFLAFRCPTNKTIYTRYMGVTKDLTEEEQCNYRYLESIANATSHTDETEDIETLEEFKLFVTKKEIEQLFNFIKLIDEKHYDEISKL
jgi:wobble nucleotide-excising tRNase